MSIKKYVVPLAVLACATLIPVKGFAFTSVTRSTETALVTFSGNGTASLAVSLALVSNGSAVAGSTITWSAPTLPYTTNSGWLIANDYIVVNSTVTAFGGGVQIYTDNVGVGANPKWGGVVISPLTNNGVAANNPEGLVSSSTNTATLPLAWSATPSTWTYTTTAGYEPNNCGVSSPVSCQWNYMEDANTPNIPTTGTTYFSPGASYVELYQGGAGLHYDSGPSGFFTNNTPGVFNVFLETNFSTALTPATYQTSTLRLESFTQ